MRDSSTLYSTHISGLIVPKALVKPLAVDFFSGAGGFSLGFESAGFDVIGAADKDPAACLTYMENLGHPAGEVQFLTWEDQKAFMAAKDLVDKRRAKEGKPPWSIGGNIGGTCRTFWLGDASLLDGDRVCRDLGIKVGQLACIFGGPPCQGFSKANRARVKNTGDSRNLLVMQMVRLILDLRPATFAIENVPGLLSMTSDDGIPMADLVVAALSEAGYGAQSVLRKALGLGNKRGAVRSQPERNQPVEFAATALAQGALFQEELANV